MTNLNLAIKLGWTLANTVWTLMTALGHKAGTDKKEATIAIENRVLEGQYTSTTLIKRLSARTRALAHWLRIARVTKRVIASIERVRSLSVTA